MLPDGNRLTAHERERVPVAPVLTIRRVVRHPHLLNAGPASHLPPRLWRHYATRFSVPVFYGSATGQADRP